MVAKTQEGRRAFIKLLTQAVFYSFNLTTIQKAAKELHLSVEDVGRLFEGLAKGDPESFLVWVRRDPRRSEAWSALTEAHADDLALLA
jgi:hypothetical protein